MRSNLLYPVKSKWTKVFLEPDESKEKEALPVKEETLEELNKLLFRHPGGPQKALDEAYRLASADERRYLAQMMSAGAARAGAT